jgi:hypothetical protein
VWIKEVEEALLSTWMLKGFLMGVALMGMLYCALHVSGLHEQSLTLAAFTTLCFLLIYVLWCSHQKQHHLNQVCNIVSIALTRYAILGASPMQYNEHRLNQVCNIGNIAYAI